MRTIATKRIRAPFHEGGKKACHPKWSRKAPVAKRAAWTALSVQGNGAGAKRLLGIADRTNTAMHQSANGTHRNAFRAEIPRNGTWHGGCSPVFTYSGVARLARV
jgi:hypothetical protein